MQIGVMVNNLERDRLRAFAVARGLGFDVVHTSALPEAWLSGPQRRAYIGAARDSGVRIETMFVGFDGQSYADIPTIRRTVGLAITSMRPHRLAITKRYSDLAAELSVPSLATHLGFLPATSEDYRDLVLALREAVQHAACNGQSFHLETGQEPAGRMLELIRDVAEPTLGVNFDAGNFILYGADEPLAAFDLLAAHIRGVHCKDGRRSSSAEALGEETPLGDGEVNFPVLIKRLHETGYTGSLVIEREAGDQLEEILRARDYLRTLVTT